MNDTAEEPRKERPHKSNRTEELYFHFHHATEQKGIVVQGGTVFFRREGTLWYGNVARCSLSDQFCRQKGRTVARRRYFNSKADGWNFCTGEEKPNYELAYDMYEAF